MKIKYKFEAWHLLIAVALVLVLNSQYHFMGGLYPLETLNEMKGYCNLTGGTITYLIDGPTCTDTANCSQGYLCDGGICKPANINFKCNCPTNTTWLEYHGCTNFPVYFCNFNNESDPGRILMETAPNTATGSTIYKNCSSTETCIEFSGIGLTFDLVKCIPTTDLSCDNDGVCEGKGHSEIGRGGMVFDLRNSLYENISTCPSDCVSWGNNRDLCVGTSGTWHEDPNCDPSIYFCVPFYCECPEICPEGGVCEQLVWDATKGCIRPPECSVDSDCGDDCFKCIEGKCEVLSGCGGYTCTTKADCPMSYACGEPVQQNCVGGKCQDLIACPPPKHNDYTVFIVVGVIIGLFLIYYFVFERGPKKGLFRK